MLIAVKKNVIVRLEEPAQPQTIVLMPASANPATAGEVVAVGSEVLDVQIGDIVSFSQHAGFKYELESVSYRTMPEDQVMAVLERKCRN